MTAYIGTPTSRVDGRAKVTGAAKYAGEFSAPDLVHASIVASAIAKGRIISIDISQAMDVDGVIAILTHQNRPAMADNDEAYKDDVAPEKGSPFRPLYDDRILFSGQPIALVLAEDWETARYAASLVRVKYNAEQPVTDLARARKDAFAVDEPAKPRGDAAKAFAAAAVRHQGEYYVPIEHHNPMEPFASTVRWEGDGKLTVYDKTQGVQNVQRYLCGVFSMNPDDVRVVSSFMGGGFGSGLRPQYQAVLAVLGARALKRSVRVVLTRQQMYSLGYRPAMIQKIQLGAKADGTLDAVTHDAVTVTSQYEDFHRNETTWSGLLYKSETARYEHKLARLDLPTSADMRAPSATTAVYALESAMDELAVALKIDPLELRLRCYSDRDQTTGLPYSSKNLRECYRQGAEAFGWSKRSPEPRSMRDGTDLVGYGMASGIWEALQVPITVRIALTANGHAQISCATSDIGTGTYTIMAQVAADALGLPLDSIDIKLGDSTLPQSPVEGGSWIAASVSNAIVNTSNAVRNELLRLAQQDPNSPLAGVKPDDTVLINGTIASKKDGNHAVSIADAMRHGAVERIEQEKATEFPNDGKHAHNTHSAIFAEVHVDEQIGVIRVPRIVCAVAAGRILNPKTAHSQVMGGAIWGMGVALHEETLIDHRFGRIMNANIAEYHIPVNADVHDIDVIFVDEQDDIVNPMGIKGLGEIGIVGVAAAIANAVYHATGKRVRDLPITLDKLR
ncbi:xanthine dehydrogenase family protein molybdopterin-binding subunit [Pseudorhodoplanes sinuspersici]|uniref:Aldehyde oxidase n=1 Tax=Pseudorhodoplanes sinuspersici TaxID=1235591 RepID=A0A1W7A2C5_9HYPH|nr:xanthine dehydrogenase family protein molybdopterin-binding subunit [Pseudorhodoplanes sinuspersici]ARQ03215.1 aldehyde oxidase [Pseudorhodoplanes sinuspersici]RKE74013.1 xanthine dehydrogenase molybdenum binding subunit apoprotein [Pseudorhodoplanes sinuspersici]